MRHPNGTYFLNGEGLVGKESQVEAAGTVFFYQKQEGGKLEFVTSKGPLRYPIEIMILYQQPNPGIKYEYMIPADQSMQPSVINARRHISYQVTLLNKINIYINNDRPYVLYI